MSVLSSMTSILLVLGLVLLPIPIWLKVKPYIIKIQIYNFNKRNLLKFKNNIDVFSSYLGKSQKIKNPTDGLGITFKKNNSDYSVVEVCNPFCNPCANASPILKNLYKKDKINLQVIFTTKYQRNSKNSKVVSHLLAISQDKDNNKTLFALNDWFENGSKNYRKFLGKNPIGFDTSNQKEKMIAMQNWCIQEKISFTPAIFINGYLIPKEYTVEDLNQIL